MDRHLQEFEPLRREAWRAIVLAAHAAAGQPLESAELDGMTPEQMQDELTYLSDFQG